MKEHRLTVGYSYRNEKEIPTLRLTGDWLSRQGFGLGKKVIVREQPGILVIQLAEEADL